LGRRSAALQPLSRYFHARGIAKIELALAGGMKAYDKRASIKERDWKARRSA
jgi:SsrA-binding protein